MIYELISDCGEYLCMSPPPYCGWFALGELLLLSSLGLYIFAIIMENIFKTKKRVDKNE